MDVLGQNQRTPSFATGLALIFPITLSTMAIILLAPVLPQLMAEFRQVRNADFLVPIVLTVPALCIALVSPLGGAIGDRFGRRRLLIASLVAYAVVGVLPIFLDDLRAILVSRIGVGIAEAMIMVASTTMIGDYFTGHGREKWLAAQTAFASVSAVLFFGIGGILGQANWRTPFWVYASSLLMLGAVLAFTWGPAEDRLSTDLTEHRASDSPRVAFPWRRMIGICAITVFASVLFYTVQIQATSGLVALGITNPASAGLLTSVASVGVPVGTLIYGRLSKVPVSRLLLGEFVGFGIGFVLMSHAGQPTGFLIGCAINQVAGGMILPTLLVWAMRQLSFEVRGRGTGLWQSCFAIGQFLSALAIGGLGRLGGGLLGSFEWFGYAAFAAAVATLVVGPRRSAKRAPAIA